MRAPECRHQEILDQQTGAWGIKVSNVEIKNIDLNQTMIHAIVKQVEPSVSAGRK